MKKHLTVIFGTGALILGVVLAGTSSSSGVGTLVTNVDTLTSVKGGCQAYQGGSCGLSSCPGSACVEPGGWGWWGNKGSLSPTDCSSEGCGQVDVAGPCSE